MKKVLLLLGMLLPLAVYAQTATKSCFQSSCLPEIEAVKTITLKPIEIVGCRSIVKSYCCEVVTISCFSTHCPINVEEELAHEEELPEEEEQFTVLVFPNPASDYVSLSSTDLDFSDAQADMFDLAGRQLNLPRIEGGQGFAYFSTKSLAAGMYIIRVRLGGQQISKPFVKVFK